MKRLAPLVLTLAAACAGGGGGPFGDDDDVASSPTPTQTATPTPAPFGGYVLVQRTRYDVAGGSPSETAYAMATFYEPIPAGDYPLQPIDTCATPAPAPSPTVTPTPVPSYDAGATLSLTGSSSVTLQRATNGSFLYYAPPGALALTDVPANGTWTFAWSGGTDLAAGSIAGELHAPASFVITSPTFATAVPLSGDLPITWTTAGAEPSDVVWLTVITGGVSLTCRLTDDGAFTIPGSQIALLPSGTGTLGGYRYRSREPLLPTGARVFAYGIWSHYGPATK